MGGGVINRQDSGVVGGGLAGGCGVRKVSAHGRTVGVT
jgi:hypothetical protein